MATATLNYSGLVDLDNLKIFTINKVVFLESDGTQNNVGMIKNWSFAPKESFHETIDNKPIPTMVAKTLIQTGGTIEFDAYEFSADNAEAAFGAAADGNNRYYLGSNEGVERKVLCYGLDRENNTLVLIGFFKAEVRAAPQIGGDVAEQGMHFVCESMLDDDGTFLAPTNSTTHQKEHGFFMLDVQSTDDEGAYAAA